MMGMLESAAIFNSLNSEIIKKSQLYDKLVVINKSFEPSSLIGIKKISIDCDENGIPSVEAMRDLFHREYFSKKNIGRVTIKQELLINKTTERVYGILLDNKPVFFIKISKSIASPTMLMILKKKYLNSSEWKNRFSNLNKKSDRRHVPILNFLEKLFVFTNPDQKSRVIEVVSAVRGRAIYTIFSSGKDVDKVTKERGLIATGRSLGLFQQIFMNYHNSHNPQQWMTTSHGDFNSRNVFYDDMKNKMYFIDNETMQEKRPISIDFIRFLKSLFQIVKTDELYAFSIFYIKGYIESFPIKRRMPILKSLKQLDCLVDVINKEVVNPESFIEKIYSCFDIMIAEYNGSN